MEVNKAIGQTAVRPYDYTDQVLEATAEFSSLVTCHLSLHLQRKGQLQIGRSQVTPELPQRLIISAGFYLAL